MAKTQTPQYDYYAILVLLERLRRMPKNGNKLISRMRKYLGGK